MISIPPEEKLDADTQTERNQEEKSEQIYLGQLSCLICGISFVDEAGIIQHLDNDHTTLCTKCDKKQNTNREFKEQIRICHSIRCLICKETFDDKELFSEHLKDMESPVIFAIKPTRIKLNSICM